MQGLMSSYPLTLTHLFERAERLFAEKTITTLTATGKERTTYAEWADRTRRLAGAFDKLGISDDGRVATFAWNTARHLELYFAAPCSGRVLHTLNIRLFPEQISYIVDHAEDEVIFADRSLVATLWPLVDGFESVKHIVVMDDGAGDVPDDDRILQYEELLSAAPVVVRSPEVHRKSPASACRPAPRRPRFRPVSHSGLTVAARPPRPWQRWPGSARRTSPRRPGPPRWPRRGRPRGR